MSQHSAIEATAITMLIYNSYSRQLIPSVDNVNNPGERKLDVFLCDQ